MTWPEFTLPASIDHAREIQQTLRQQTRLNDEFEALSLIAGVDVGYDVEQGLAHASIVTMHADALKPIEQVEAYVPVDFPYIPGFLSFREIPAILAALQKLQKQPDLLMVDGQGVAHPRRMGIAAHLGTLLDRPSIGVAKSRLTGVFDMPQEHKGSLSALMDKGERIGTVLRSKDKVAPLFISPGHRVSLDTAVAVTLKCLVRHRLPEPTRMADKLSKCNKTGELKQAVLV